MKVREVIAAKVARLMGTGVTPRYLILTANALERLIKEVHAADGENAALALTRAEAVVTYADLEVVVAELGRLDPIEVSGIVREEMEIFNLRMPKQ